MVWPKEWRLKSGSEVSEWKCEQRKGTTQEHVLEFVFSMPQTEGRVNEFTESEIASQGAGRQEN